MPTRIKKFFSRLVPAEEVAGIEITDSACRLLMLSREDFKITAIAEASLAPEAVVGGAVKNIAHLTETLSNLKKQAGKHFQSHPAAILTLPSAIFFTHVIELPEVPESAYEEAARLNAAQLSPIRLEESYFDWQNLGVNLKTLEREILIAVSSKSKINLYLEALRQANIEAVAVEPNPLSLIRLLNYFAATAEKNSPYIIISIGQDAVSFVITKEGKPFFDRHVFWQEVMPSKDIVVTRRDFEKVLIEETGRLLNFYRTHYEETVSRVVLLSPILKQELATLLKEEFNLKTIGLRFPSFTGSQPLSDLWAGTLGAALRGTIPRQDDTIVSLMSPGTEEAYARIRLLSFLSLWSKITIGTLAGLLIVAGISTAVLLGFRKQLETTLSQIRVMPSASESEVLRKEALRFNELVSAIRMGENQVFLWSPALEVIVEGAESNNVKLERLTLSRETKEIKILGQAPLRQKAIDFKKNLEDSKKFSAVDLPLGSFSQVAGGVSFSINLTMK